MRQHAGYLGFIFSCQQKSRIHIDVAARNGKGINLLGIVEHGNAIGYFWPVQEALSYQRLGQLAEGRWPQPEGMRSKNSLRPPPGKPGHWG